MKTPRRTDVWSVLEQRLQAFGVRLHPPACVEGLDRGTAAALAELRHEQLAAAAASALARLPAPRRRRPRHAAGYMRELELACEFASLITAGASPEVALKDLARRRRRSPVTVLEQLQRRRAVLNRQARRGELEVDWQTRLAALRQLPQKWDVLP